MGLIIPKCNADPKTLDLTLKVYYEVDDWVENATLIDKLSALLIEEGIENEKKEPQSYTKKTQVLSYYGLLEWEDESNDQSRRRITTDGRLLYEYRQKKDNIAIYSLLIDILRKKTFGRNVLGCNSDSDLEAPNIFLKSCLLIKNLTNKEFAYILGRMEYDQLDFGDVLFEVVIQRQQGKVIQPNKESSKWSDPKPILALADWGIFVVTKLGLSKIYNINKEILDLFSNDLISLRIKNTDVQRWKSVEEEEVELKHIDLESITFDKNLLTSLKTKPFLLLAGISGTGKSRVVKQMAFESCPNLPSLRTDKTSPGNYQLIEVKPNWHDSSELLGYESEIGGAHYVVTPFVKFLVKAMMYEDKAPFFVCMDEMNLAPVEQYFAEYLSVLESRKLVDRKITSEPLVKAYIFEKYEDKLKEELFGKYKDEVVEGQDEEGVSYETLTDRIYERLKQEGLRLPSNLLVIGTVNMDETTHQFSRKVIDRAMTIEMNIEKGKEPFDSFFEDTVDLQYYDDCVPKEAFLPIVVQASEAMGRMSAEDAKYLKNEIPNLLATLNDTIESTPFKIAYRVQNELVLYFFSLRRENTENDAEELLAEAFDAILMQKVLPRVEGDEDLLEKPLEKLADFTAPYKNANNKVKEMQERLKRAHFTSFWP